MNGISLNTEKEKHLYHKLAHFYILWVNYDKNHHKCSYNCCSIINIQSCKKTDMLCFVAKNLHFGLYVWTLFPV